ncbi:MAG: DCC1-like thiol-disulfide oxidoreductase family protein [Reichenbachiella sp.]|uniref:thiol-disulfide oxidoreductase DCC family protein n=1 Tax=Reichenbachiella sp. TaxID=2184521 RepID=UPI003265AF43
MGSDREVNHLILYDGVCRFCNHSVNFILDHERNEKLRFTALQSELGKSILLKYNLPEDYTESLLYLENNNLYSHSKAAFKISNFLKMPWRIVVVFSLLPSILTDWGYNKIAKHRYALMGTTDACMIPGPESKSRFLE